MEYIDTSFDKVFEKSNLFPWLPWIGKHFSNSNKRTLVLGESTYNWAVRNESRENIQERISQNDHLRIVHKNNAINFNGKSPYARNIERAIFFKKNLQNPMQYFYGHLLPIIISYCGLCPQKKSDQTIKIT